MKKLQNKDSKNRYQNVKGITLIALVVTIVVLLILAGVTIVTLFGENGIISKAQKAKQETQEGVKNELDDLDKLGDIDKYINGDKNEGKWQEVKNEKGQVTAVEKGNQKIEIGDYINYDCTKNASGQTITESYTSKKYDEKNKNQSSSGYSKDQTFKASNYARKWRVLGAENGELLIMAAANVPLTVGSSTNTSKYFYLGDLEAEQGKVAYKYGPEELDNISKIYAKGKGASGKARSIKVEDVNAITGYDPTRTGNTDNNPCNKNELFEYNNEVTYTWKGGTAPAYTASNGYTPGTLRTDHNTATYGFTYWNEDSNDWITSKYTSEVQTSPITTLTSTYYNYYPETLTYPKDTNSTAGIANNSKQYEMLFGGTSSGDSYWLGSRSVYTFLYYTSFGLHNVYDGYVNGFDLFCSYGIGDYNSYGVRPVVSLKSDIKLEKGSTDSNGNTTWNIK